MRVVAKHHQAAVQHAFALDGNVVKHILGLLEAGGCIDVASEFGADALQPVQDALSGEVLRAVEAHVLEEVGQAVLVGSFQYCTRVRGKIKLYALCGQFVVTDVISETVIELANLDGRISG